MTEVKLSAFVNRLFHEDFFSIYGTIVLSEFNDTYGLRKK